MLHLAYFITPHGFGHAARATAVMLACLQKRRDIWFDLYTTVPNWFFEDSRLNNYTIHPLTCDIGMVQKDSLTEDIPATIRALESFYPISKPLIDKLSQELKSNHIKGILCDISPLGVPLAQYLNVPSVLIENFTWDWIYESYLLYERKFQHIIEYLQSIYAQVSYHIQAQPACVIKSSDLSVNPISRPVYTSRDDIRVRLGIPLNAPAVLISMGGIETNHFPVEILRKMSNIYFVLPGGAKTFQIQDNIIFLPHRSGYYHTDLMNSCDAIIGKLGYSTLAEAFYTGTPYGFIPRPHFRETIPLSQFVIAEMGGVEIPIDTFWSDSLQENIEQLLKKDKKRAGVNGAEQVSDFILQLFK